VHFLLYKICFILYRLYKMKKRILSFDVGIKNLAYCLMERNNDDFEILEWDIINLTDDMQKCMYCNNGKKQCENLAKFSIIDKDNNNLFKKLINNNDNNTIHVCKAHKNKVVPKIIPIKENIKKVIKKKKGKKEDTENIECNENKVRTCIVSGCDMQAKHEVSINTDLCWCDKHIDKYGKQFGKKVAVKKITNTNCNKQPLQELSEKLFLKLDQKKRFMEAEEILIENQPTLTNPTMKTISILLYAYFGMRGTIDKKITQSKMELNRLISPSNKLKVNKETTDNIIGGDKTKGKDNKDNKEKDAKTYKLTKKLGVKYCFALINENDKKKLEKYKKKDDLCDSFLQGFQYLFAPVPEKYMEQLKKIDLQNNSEESNKENNTENAENAENVQNKKAEKKIKKRVKKTIIKI
jgi:hypothetical protein